MPVCPRCGGDRLVLDVGEQSSEFRPRANTAGEVALYLLADPLLSLLSEGGISTVPFVGTADDQPRLNLTMAANQTGPERVFVFAPVAAPRPRPNNVEVLLRKASGEAFRPSWAG